MPVDPANFASTPFDNKTAWLDFVGTHYLWHVALAEQVRVLTGERYRVLPIGDGGTETWLQGVQATYQAASDALGLPGPPDLESYDLEQPEDHASWCFIISQQARTLRAASGLA